MSDTVRTPDDLAGLNYRLPEPIDTNVVRARLNAADDKVDALCDGTERWVMRVPPQPNRDPDLVIGAALMAAHQTVTALEAARDEAAELRAALDEAANLLEDALVQGCHQVTAGDGRDPDLIGWFDTMALSVWVDVGDWLVAHAGWERHPYGVGRRQFYRPGLAGGEQ